ncbi:LysR family transcriptional regulator [Desulfosarcina cetonica]|uniref:LysR family transcriptional regulator n=1 Tax=Desulfosarcina cetonica TaxID=90730 RepID=UPI0006CFFA0B|nr:LysR family transcriptional regulator [Desulfosarcina cetonica]
MQNTMDWNDYHYFLKVAVLGSLNAAAEALSVNHSTVFRRINALEARMDVRLFERLKTGYVLTEAGEEILQRVQAVEEEMHAIQRTLLGKDIRLSGTLKISTTDTLGYHWLPPYIRRFKARYNDIRIDVDIKTRYTNLTKREADIVIPAVNTQPETMVGWKLAPILIRLYAAVDYIAQNGRPRTPEEFAGHHFLLPNEALAGLPADRWLRRLIPESAIVATSDKLTGLYHLARQGLGLTFLPHYVGDTDERLVAVMDLPENCYHDIWILTHPDLRHTARVKAFMQFMFEATRGERGALTDP